MTDRSDYADFGVPTQEDMERAEGWRKARWDWAPAWLLLSPEQQSWVDRRIAWVDHFEMISGADLIAAERKRQVEAEGWTPEHDDEHNTGEMVDAAICYADMALRQVSWSKPPLHKMLARWPWDPEWWKPSDDPLRNLVKAGALIAAEIDRVQRLASGSEANDG